MSDQSNQADSIYSTKENDPHMSTGSGKSIKMPNAGVTHHGSVNYDATTESDDNKK